MYTKKPHQQATNCLCVPMFPHLFMDLCHEHDCISDAETESYKSLPSLSIIHRPLRCLQMSSDVFRLQPKGMVILATTSFAPVPGWEMWRRQQILPKPWTEAVQP